MRNTLFGARILSTHSIHSGNATRTTSKTSFFCRCFCTVCVGHCYEWDLRLHQRAENKHHPFSKPPITKSANKSQSKKHQKYASLSNFVALHTLKQLLKTFKQTNNQSAGQLLVGLILLCSLFSNTLTGQTTPPPKRVFLNESDFESIITYSARDSIFTDFKKHQVHLYGEAHLFYDEVDMRADYLLLDLGKKEVLAIYTLDSLNNRVGEPIFVDNGDTVRAASIRYNFETKKGYIQEVAIQQQDYYLSMEVAKRQENGNIHFVRGKFTTCNLEEPHFHFFLSKAVLVPDKRIVTGPMNLWVMGVPTPLGLPFAVLPQQKEREKPNGFILPQLSLVSPYGMGFLDLGYYIPINEKLQTTFFGTAYSRGSLGIRNKTDYAIRYKFNGSLDVGYYHYRFGFPSTSPIKTASIRWTHVQDAKANPNWSFNSNVNFNSNSTNKQTLYTQNDQYFNNTLNSDVNLGKKFGSKPISANMKLSMRQNSQSKMTDLTAPLFNFQTTSRIFPFKSINKVIGFTYANEIANRSTYKDRYLKNQDFDSINQQFRSGANQRFNLSATFNLLKNTIRITPNVNYTQYYNFQSISKTIDTLTNLAVTDSLNIGGFSHSFSASASMTTTLYSYYRFIGKRKTLLRHVATPTVSFSYSPSILTGMETYTDTLGKVIEYNRFERSIYAQGLGTSSGKINFGLNNTFEIKQKDDRDTVTGFKKTKIIDNFLLNANYDIFKDSMNWSDVNMSIVINPISAFNITLNGIYSLYSWNDTTGVRSSQYAFQTNQGWGRFTSFNVNTNWTLTSKKSRELLDDRQDQLLNTWNPQYQQWLTSPSQLILFEIPWKLTFEHILSFNTNTDISTYAMKRFVPTNTLRISGDFSITENWKIASTALLDIQSGKISNLNLNLFRNIHCWNVTFNWTPIGTNKNFTVGIRGNAAALQNVNLNLRRPPIVL